MAWHTTLSHRNWQPCVNANIAGEHLASVMPMLEAMRTNSWRSIRAAAAASAAANSAALVGSPCLVSRRAAVTPRLASRRRSSSSASPGLVSSQASSQPVAPSPSPCSQCCFAASIGQEAHVPPWCHVCRHSREPRRIKAK